MCGWFKGIFKVKINDHHCPPRGFSLHVDTGPSEVVLKRCDFLWPRPCSFHPEGELGEHALHCAFHRKWTKCSIKSCYRKTVTSSTIDLASGSTVLCVRIRTLCVIITHQTVNLIVSAICPRQRFLDCVLLVKKGVFLLNIYRNFCRLYSPIRDPGSIFKMHKIPAAQRPVHIIFPAYTQAL